MLMVANGGSHVKGSFQHNYVDFVEALHKGREMCYPTKQYNDYKSSNRLIYAHPLAQD